MSEQLYSLLRLSRFCCLLWALIICQGCSGLMTRTAVQTMSTVLGRGLPAYERETDVAFATQALAANLKFIEALLETDPGNEALLLHAAQGFGTYAYAVVEGQLAAEPGALHHTQRARQFYQRGLIFGLRLLSRYQRGWQREHALADAEFSSRLHQVGSESVPALFWTAFCWGGQLNQSRDALETITALPRFESLVTRLIALDDSYFYGMSHLLLAVHYAGRSPALGGRPEKARQAFARAKALSQGRLLIVPLLEAQYYAVQTQDRELFKALLQQILAAPDTLFPEQALLNAVAKQRAALLLQRLDDLFV